MSAVFWLDDDAWAVARDGLPAVGASRMDDPPADGSGRGCPRTYGPYTSVRTRFNRWSRRRLWQKLPQALAEAGHIRETVSIDSSYVKAHRSGGGAKGGAEAQAIGVSRGGRATKIHLATDLLGRPIALCLTPGNAADIRTAPALVAAADACKRLIADRGRARPRAGLRPDPGDSDAVRQSLRADGVAPVIPGHRNRARPVRHDRRRYRERWRIEASFCRLKDFRRAATR